MDVRPGPGSDAAPRPAAPPAAIRQRLGSTPVAWLTTVRPDGAPHLVPVWFLWVDEGFVVFSKPDARKTRNVEAEDRVMLAFGRAEDDFDVQLVEGKAHVMPVTAADILPALAAELEAKYGEWMDAIGLTLDEFAATYRAVIRIEPTNFLGWRGRTGGRDMSASRQSGRKERPERAPVRRLRLAGSAA